MSGEMVVMKKPVVGCGAGMVREATTGRVVSVLPRVWAVGTGIAGGREHALPCAVRKLPLEDGDRSAAASGDSEAVAERKTEAGAETEVAFYRKYTEAVLRRYQRLRLSSGRVPSPMDREMFRGRMSHYKVQGFDDAVIFCTDVERCFGRLNGEDQRLLRRVAVQEYSMGEAAGLLGMSLRNSIVLYRRALDRMTRLFLQARILEPEKAVSRGRA